MMNWYDGGVAWWAWMFMGLCMVLFAGFVAWVVVTLTRRGTSSRLPEDLLAERLARGEIGEDQFRRQRDLVRH